MLGDPPEQADPSLGMDPEQEPAPEEQPQDPLTTYWAAGEVEHALATLHEKHDTFFAVARERGFVAMWRIGHAQRFGQDPVTPGNFDTQTIGVEGVHGDQLRFRINEPRSFLRQSVTMVVGQRAAFQAVAQNTDTAALAIAPAVDQGVDHFYRAEMPDHKERELMTDEGSYGGAYVWWRWDKWAGDDVKVGTKQQPIPPEALAAKGIALGPFDPQPTAPVDVFGPSGAPVARLLVPWQEFHEIRPQGRHLWRCAKEWRSKWELMTLYPEQAEQIRAMHSDSTTTEREIFGRSQHMDDSDDLEVWHFYHVPIGDPNDPANPLATGRYISSVSGKVPLSDSRMPTSRKVGIPIVEVMSAPMKDVALGYADWWDMIALQMGEDEVVSDIMSNLHAFGRVNAFQDEDSDVDVDSLSAGGAVFSVVKGGTPPGFMQPPQIGQSGPWMVEYTGRMKQSISGQNATARGNPPANVGSGTFAALLVQTADEFNSDKQSVLREARIASANIIADLILLNAENDLMIQIAGTEDRPYIQAFRAEQLQGIRKIDMVDQPPIMRTSAGRAQLFDMLKDVPPEQRQAAVMLLTTGQSRQITDTDSAKFLRVKWENEQLTSGDPQRVALVKVSAHDNPFDDVPQHVKLYNELAINPEANRDAIAAVEQHVMAHLQQFYRDDPILCAMNKFPPPPPPPMTPSAQPGAPPPAPPGNGAPGGGGGSAAKDVQRAQGGPDGGKQPGLPSPAQPPQAPGPAQGP